MTASRYPAAIWRPLPEASTQPAIRPVQVILHTIVGSAAGAIRIMEGDTTPGESHFVNPFKGQVTQLMPVTRRADCNWKVNAWVTPIDLVLEDGVTVPAGTVCGAISIESEDDGTPEDTLWNQNQLDHFASLLAWARDEWQIPLDRCPDPFLPGVGFHSMFGYNRLKVWEPNAVPPYGTVMLDGRQVNIHNPWTNAVGKSCPGPARIGQFDGIVTAARALAEPTPVPPPILPPAPPAVTPEVHKVFLIVGNADNHDDPRRWVWDGATSLRYLTSPAEHQELLNRQTVGLLELHPAFSTLTTPFWMSTAERARYGQP